MKYVFGIIAAALLFFGGWYYFSASGAGTDTSESAQAPAQQESTSAMPVIPAEGGSPVQEMVVSTAPQAATVTYASSGFSPASVTIKKGESVTFVNQSGARMWVASGPHPAHTGYSGTDRSAHCPDAAGVAFDQCAAGDSYTFTFEKAGTWKYHNHVDSEDTGVVIVQ